MESNNAKFPDDPSVTLTIRLIMQGKVSHLNMYWFNSRGYPSRHTKWLILLCWVFKSTLQLHKVTRSQMCSSKLHQILFGITSRKSKTNFWNYIIRTLFLSPVWQRAQLNRDSSFNQSHDSSSKSLIFRSFASDSLLNFSFSSFYSRLVHQTSRSAQNFNEIVSNIASCRWFPLIESISLLFYLPTSFRLWLRCSILCVAFVRCCDGAYLFAALSATKTTPRLIKIIFQYVCFLHPVSLASLSSPLVSFVFINFC